MFENPPNLPDELAQHVSNKSLSDELFLHFSFESSESDRVFNYLHDSKSIFRAGDLRFPPNSTRGIDHLVQEQLRDSRSAEQSGPWETASAPRQEYRVTVILVRTGHDAEHHEPEERREHSAKCTVISKTSRVLPTLSTTRRPTIKGTHRGVQRNQETKHAHAIADKRRRARPQTGSKNVLVVHTGHDAEHLRPGDDRKEHSASSTIACTTAIVEDEHGSCITVLLVHTNHDVWPHGPAWHPGGGQGMPSTWPQRPLQPTPPLLSRSSTCARRDRASAFAVEDA